MATATLKIKNCMDCPHHKVVRDPDPHDWFNDDDQAVLCSKTPNKKKETPFAGGAPFEFKPISVSVRPYNLRKESEVPGWCPLLKGEKK